MKIPSLICILFILCFSLTAQTSVTIIYLQKNKLDWLDFKEVPIKNDTIKEFYFSSNIRMKIVIVNT